MISLHCIGGLDVAWGTKWMMSIKCCTHLVAHVTCLLTTAGVSMEMDGRWDMRHAPTWTYREGEREWMRQGLRVANETIWCKEDVLYCFQCFQRVLRGAC